MHFTVYCTAEVTIVGNMYFFKMKVKVDYEEMLAWQIFSDIS